MAKRPRRPEFSIQSQRWQIEGDGTPLLPLRAHFSSVDCQDCRSACPAATSKPTVAIGAMHRAATDEPTNCSAIVAQVNRFSEHGCPCLMATPTRKVGSIIPKLQLNNQQPTINPKGWGRRRRRNQRARLERLPPQ